MDDQEYDASDEAKVSAEGEGIGRDTENGADPADKTVDAAAADDRLPIDEKAVNRDPVGAKLVDVSMVDAVPVKPVNESVPAKGAEVNC